ncbi:hypothetical protein C1H46_037451 [Malus baccata]|uniref:Uncharacterized protein n=1 Tax=Malus baccata TaxID=106549 RepID=A0A540KRZ8_MALBA|nr:hypothetical protein C1H46_037451 [Malus baccata]
MSVPNACLPHILSTRYAVRFQSTWLRYFERVRRAPVDSSARVFNTPPSSPSLCLPSLVVSFGVFLRTSSTFWLRLGRSVQLPWLGSAELLDWIWRQLKDFLWVNPENFCWGLETLFCL